MRTEADLRRIIEKAVRADELLNDPLVQEFIIALRGDLLNKFESATLKDEALRLNAWNQSQVLNKFLDKFTKTIRDGKNAKLTLLEKTSKKLKRVI